MGLEHLRSHRKLVEKSAQKTTVGRKGRKKTGSYLASKPSI